jgi:hypothetical protein
VVVEELDSGGGDEPSHLGPVAWVAIALACLVGGLLLLSGPRGGPTAAEPGFTPPVQTFSAVPIPGPSVQPVPDDPSQVLTIGLVCPATTDGRKSLSVSFVLVNVGGTDVTLLSVVPLLPMNGMQPVGKTTTGGTCAQPGTEVGGGLLAPGEQRLFTMRFLLSTDCPQALPVQASVRLRVNQMVGTTTVPVFSDLGSVHFDMCTSTNP